MGQAKDWIHAAGWAGLMATYRTIRDPSLLALVRPDGQLGWVQPVAALPAPTTAETTAPFGVGAFLLATTEVARISDPDFVRAISA
ncbi:MAG TPA: hypothetical protein VH374_01135 [Polyangia bacterium]|nr:hypothetical protein [Polyangia bacterium]